MPHFMIATMTGEALADLDDLARRYGVTPSAYLGLTGTDEATLYWRWCVDDACRRAANYLDAVDAWARAHPDYMPVEPE